MFKLSQFSVHGTCCLRAERNRSASILRIAAKTGKLHRLFVKEKEYINFICKNNAAIGYVTIKNKKELIFVNFVAKKLTELADKGCLLK